MVNIVHVRRLLKAGETADSWFPSETEGVTTTTVADNKLAKFQPRQEAAMIEAFGPDYHIPTDFPVYGEFDRERRVKNARRAAAGTLWMDEHLADEVTLLPLIKGTTPDERAICEEVVDRLDAPMAVKYGVQYVSVGGNGGMGTLTSDLAAIAAETNGLPILCIGPMAPGSHLGIQKYPPNVWAAAGTNAWVKRVEPRSSSPESMRVKYDLFANAVANALDVPQRYNSQEVATEADQAASMSHSQG